MANHKLTCPALSDLPAPPPDKTGWPWTESGRPLPSTLPDGQPWPKITVVTPSYNQGAFIEETIRSVLLQGYPNLEYLVIDGGSRDNSVEVIKQYEPWLTYWVSEPDNGQSHAINKGFALATGSLLGWENSDDLLTPNALEHLAKSHFKHPQSLIVGNVIEFDETGDITILKQQNLTLRNFVEFWAHRHRWHMPGIFYSRSLVREVGHLDENLRYLFDMDLVCRLLQIAPVVYVDRPVARFRYHRASKTEAEFDGFMTEALIVSQRYREKVGKVDERGLNPYRAEGYALVGFKSIRRRQIRFGLNWLARSLRLGPVGLFRYVYHAAARRINKYVYRFQTKKD